MIGEIRKAKTPFYNQREGKLGFKSRPVLIIAKADDSDYIVLPVSRVTNRAMVNPIYDIQIDPMDYPDANLECISYIRTNKQTIVNKRDIGDRICSLKEVYPELYVYILSMREQFSIEITDQALD